MCIRDRKYDDQFSYSQIGKGQRDIVWSYLSHHFSAAQNILELNCGTGEDAVFLASKSHKILATDRSKEMLQITKQKVHQNEYMDRVVTLPLDLSKPESLNLQMPVDLIFSNFGGLNCINPKALSNLAQYCFDWLTPNGQLVLVVMPRHTLLDRWYRIKHGQWSKIKNRRAGKDMVNVEGTQFETYYYNQAQLKEAFGQFKVVSTQVVGIIPSYLCLLYTSPSPRDRTRSRMPSSA